MAAVVGLVVGALARMLMPGEQKMGWILTCLLGIGGSRIVRSAVVSVREHMSIVLRRLQGRRFVEFHELFDAARGVLEETQNPGRLLSWSGITKLMFE